VIRIAKRHHTRNRYYLLSKPLLSAERAVPEQEREAAGNGTRLGRGSGGGWQVGQFVGWAFLLMDAEPVARVHCQGGE